MNSIRGIGGIERVTLIKANALSEIEGNQIFVVVTDDNHGNYCDTISKKVDFINLNINYYDNDWQPGLSAKLSQIRKRGLHKKLLREVLNKIQPDIVIAVGQSEKFFCRKGLVKTSYPVYIRELHFATNYRESLAQNGKAKMIGRILSFIDFGILCRFYYDIVVCLTPEDLNKNWRGRKNVASMPNPLTISRPANKENSFESNSSAKKIVAIGRLSYQKNFESLIRSFALISSSNPEWILEIYGEGDDRKNLESVISSLNLYGIVKLMGATSDVASVLSSASFFVLSSRLEGFPLVLLEAMVHKLPVISYNCDFGPSFIIENGINGFLVPLNDEQKLASKMQLLIDDPILLARMGENAHKRAESFSPDIIADNWMDLFHNLIAKKKC